MSAPTHAERDGAANAFLDPKIDPETLEVAPGTVHHSVEGWVPQLATEWSWSPDNLALTVRLRDGVTFHDGEAFDAAAVKANIERYKTAPESKRSSNPFTLCWRETAPAGRSIPSLPI